MSATVYLDTSALAKRYLREPGSDEVDIFLGNLASVSISRLAVVELRCLLGRRRRNREITPPLERKVFAAFEEDVALGFFEVHPLEDRQVLGALDLLGRMTRYPLRTLDAIHLAVANAIGARVFASADHMLARVAAALGLRVERFG